MSVCQFGKFDLAILNCCFRLFQLRGYRDLWRPLLAGADSCALILLLQGCLAAKMSLSAGWDIPAVQNILFAMEFPIANMRFENKAKWHTGKEVALPLQL